MYRRHRAAPRGRHKNQQKQRTPRRASGATTTICGLVAFNDRDTARRAAKTMPWNGAHARTYECRDGCGLWHAGYLPALVIAGVVSVGEWYGYRGRPMRDVLLPLLNKIQRQTGSPGTFQRRISADDVPRWIAVVETRDHGTLYGPDRGTPREAVTAVLAEYGQLSAPKEEAA